MAEGYKYYYFIMRGVIHTMKKFANVLNSYLEEQNLSCRYAAKLCNMNRITLLRYKTGERRPRNKEGVLQIAKGLEMSEKNRELLLTAYYADKNEKKYDAGETVIKNLFEGNFDSNFDLYNDFFEKEIKEGEHTKTDMQPLLSKHDILSAVWGLIENAENICFCVNIESVEIMNLVHRRIVGNQTCHVEQILKNSDLEKKEHIFYCFEKLIPLLFLQNYRIWSQIQWESNPENCDLQMNFIITKEGVLLFNSGMSYGILMKESDYVLYYEKKLQNFKEYKIFMENVEDKDLNMSENTFACHCNEKIGIEFRLYDDSNVFIKKRTENKTIWLREEIIIKKIWEFFGDLTND